MTTSFNVENFGPGKLIVSEQWIERHADATDVKGRDMVVDVGEKRLCVCYKDHEYRIFESAP